MTKFCPRCEKHLSCDLFSGDPHRKDGYRPYCKSCSAEYVREHRKKNEGNHYKATKAWKLRNPEKVSAHKAIHRAAKSGAINRPHLCSLCKMGRIPIQAHHSNYKNWLDVEWVCATCHATLDRGLGSLQTSVEGVD